MLKTIKDLIAKPAPWLYFVLVVALLIILTNSSGTINDLEAELENANAEISASDTLTESLSDEIAIRNDAIAGLEEDSAAVNARLNDVDSQRVALEVQVATLSGLLEDTIANPICPAAEACPEVEVCPEPATTETATQ
jgi:septal ring factor EnvC (AmiA/AmiB activator)